MSSPAPTNHFSSHAALYASRRPHYPDELALFLASCTPKHDLAWDVGCGSGQLSVLLGERFEQVIATDASREQIAQSVPHPKVVYQVQPAERSELKDHVVDLVVAAQAAHWFDLDCFYEEVRRVGRAHGAVALVSYGIVRIDARIDPVVSRFYGETLKGHWPPERRHVEDGYRSIAFPFPDIDAPAMEMAADWNLPEFLGYVDTWSAVRSLERQRGRAPFDAFAQELGRVWGSSREPRTIRWPLALRVGRL
jgi:SAM-dependent methyltransferase